VTCSRALAGLAGLAALAWTASAEADPRIATRLYEAANVVVVHGAPGVESTIAFADDERIENVAVGDSAKWQVTPNKRANLLFVKPANLRARSNMTVVTDQHTYLFDLVSGGAAPVYMLRFTYPARPRPLVVAAAIPAAAVTPVPAAGAPPPTPNPADLNFAWETAGDKALLPSRTFDDGRSVFLSWPKDTALPAVLTRTATGQEGPVNFTVQGDYLVVDGVPPQLILRAGKAVATLTPHPRAPTQTASARP
jgi:type IV secretion system protein VirB9